MNLGVAHVRHSLAIALVFSLSLFRWMHDDNNSVCVPGRSVTSVFRVNIVRLASGLSYFFPSVFDEFFIVLVSVNTQCTQFKWFAYCCPGMELTLH